MQARAHWLTETPTAAGTEFHVLQRRLDPLIFLKNGSFGSSRPSA
jgi:hypothetical protein